MIALSFLTEKKMKKRIEEESEVQKSELYKKKLEEITLNENDRKRIVDKIGDLAKDFFMVFYNIPKKIEYSKLYEIFRAQNNIKGMEFSKTMVYVYYSPQKITNNIIENLKEGFKSIIDDNTLRIRKRYEEKKRSDKEKKEIIINIEKKINRLDRSLAAAKEKHPGVFVEFKESNSLLDEILNQINSFVRENYMSLEENKKREIISLLYSWKNKICEIIRNSNDPFERIMSLHLLTKENFKKLKETLKK